MCNHCTEDPRDRIHLAGSEFAPDFPGYLEGAVLAAERAVDALQAQLGSGNARSSSGQSAAAALPAASRAAPQTGENGGEWI